MDYLCSSLILVLFKSSKLLNNLSSKIIVATLSALSIFYIGLQTYGIINNNYYEPITSFIQKEQNIKFITVKTTRDYSKKSIKVMSLLWLIYMQIGV